MLTGEVDIGAAPELVQALMQFHGRAVDVDLAEVTLMDSSGIGAILRSRGAGVQIRLVQVPARLRRVFEITGLQDLLQ